MTEIRSTSGTIECRDSSTGMGGPARRQLTGCAALFDSVTTIGGVFREVIRPGAFDRALRERDDVRALYNHDPSYALGRTTAGTLDLSVDRRGLQYRVALPDTSWARDLWELVQRGDVSQSSFAFAVDEDTWPHVRDGLPLREIRSVRLYDVSPVTFPAYSQTTVSTGRTASAQTSISPTRWLALRRREIALKALSL